MNWYANGYNKYFSRYNGVQNKTHVVNLFAFFTNEIQPKHPKISILARDARILKQQKVFSEIEERDNFSMLKHVCSGLHIVLKIAKQVCSELFIMLKIPIIYVCSLIVT
jgi:hypothetical protein